MIRQLLAKFRQHKKEEPRKETCDHCKHLYYIPKKDKFMIYNMNDIYEMIDILKSPYKENMGN